MHKTEQSARFIYILCLFHCQHHYIDRNIYEQWTVFSKTVTFEMKRKNEKKMGEVNPSRKTPKSKIAIRDALISTLAVKPIEKISISEIAEKAGVNRKTFYSYYDRIEDVCAEIEDELISDMEALLQSLLIDEYGLGPQYFLQFINLLYSSSPEFFENLVSIQNYHFLASRIKQSLKKQIILSMDVPPEKKERLELLIEFYLAGAVAIYIDWIKKGKPVSFEEITMTIFSFIRDGVKL